MVSYPLPAPSIDPEFLYKSPTTSFLCLPGSNAISLHISKKHHICTNIPRMTWSLTLRSWTRQPKSTTNLNIFVLAPTLAGLFNFKFNTIQLTSGIRCPILQDTHALPWHKNDWITTTCTFLHQIQGQIHLQNPCLLPPCKHNDQHVMEDIASLDIPSKDKKWLNTQDFTYAYPHLY